MSGSFESVRWNACEHRLDLGLHSHPKEFWGNGARTYVNSKGKISSAGKKSSQRNRDPILCCSYGSMTPTSKRGNRRTDKRVCSSLFVGCLTS